MRTTNRIAANSESGTTTTVDPATNGDITGHNAFVPVGVDVAATAISGGP
jgi:hypothetical protein